MQPIAHNLESSNNIVLTYVSPEPSWVPHPQEVLS